MESATWRARASASARSAGVSRCSLASPTLVRVLSGRVLMARCFTTADSRRRRKSRSFGPGERGQARGAHLGDPLPEGVHDALAADLLGDAGVRGEEVAEPDTRELVQQG